MKTTYDKTERDKGGRKLKGKKWLVTNFIVEVAVEYPKDTSIEEAMENACEFISTFSRGSGRLHGCYASITRIDECGSKRPVDCPVVIREYPKGKKTVVKAKKKVKRI